MKALVVYTLFVVVGAVLSSFVGLYLERQFSETLALVVFLVLFFSNFAICWILTILTMDGTLANAQGTQEQRDIEASGRAQLARSNKA
jgi:uncharacterized membrane protein YfcA